MLWRIFKCNISHHVDGIYVIACRDLCICNTCICMYNVHAHVLCYYDYKYKIYRNDSKLNDNLNKNDRQPESIQGSLSI